MGAVQSAGLTLERVLGWLGAGWDEALAALSVARWPPSGDPVFLPHLSGERTPWLDPGMRGAWTGLGLEHDRRRAAPVRARRGGLRRGRRLGRRRGDGRRSGLPFLVGGGSVHPAWRQLLADTLRTPLQPVAAPHAGVLGAAALALAGTGALELADAVERLEQVARGPGAPQYVEPDIGAIGWVLELRARFEDARHRLAQPGR